MAILNARREVFGGGGEGPGHLAPWVTELLKVRSVSFYLYDLQGQTMPGTFEVLRNIS